MYERTCKNCCRWAHYGLVHEQNKIFVDFNHDAFVLHSNSALIILWILGFYSAVISCYCTIVSVCFYILFTFNYSLCVTSFIMASSSSSAMVDIFLIRLLNVCFCGLRPTAAGMGSYTYCLSLMGRILALVWRQLTLL